MLFLNIFLYQTIIVRLMEGEKCTLDRTEIITSEFQLGISSKFLTKALFQIACIVQCWIGLSNSSENHQRGSNPIDSAARNPHHRFFSTVTLSQGRINNLGRSKLFISIAYEVDQVDNYICSKYVLRSWGTSAVRLKRNFQLAGKIIFSKNYFIRLWSV